MFNKKKKACNDKKFNECGKKRWNERWCRSKTNGKDEISTVVVQYVLLLNQNDQ